MADSLVIDIDTTAAKAGLDALRQSFADLQASVTNIGTGAADGIKSLASSLAGLKGVDGAAIQSFADLAKAASALSGVGGGLSSVVSAFQQLNNLNLNNISTQFQQMVTAMNQFAPPAGLATMAQQFQQMGQAVQTAQQQLANIVNSVNVVGSAFNAARGWIRQFFEAFAVASLGAFVRESYELTNSLNGLANITNNVGRSMTTSAAEIEFLKDVAAATGQQFGSLIDAYKRFYNVASQTNLTVSQQKDSFATLNMMMTATGVSGAQMTRAWLAINEIMAQGQVTIGRVNRQLGNDLPGSLQAAARGAGVTVKAFEDMVKAGMESSVFIGYLTKGIKELYAAGLDTALGQILAAMNALSSSFQKFQVAFGEGFFTGITQSVQALANAIANPGFQAFATLVGKVMAVAVSAFLDALTGAIAVIGGFATAIKYVVDTVGVWTGLMTQAKDGTIQLTDAGRALGTALSTAAAAVGYLIAFNIARWALAGTAALLGLTAATTGVGAAATGVLGVFTRFGTAIRGIFTAIGTGSLAAIVAAFGGWGVVIAAAAAAVGLLAYKFSTANTAAEIAKQKLQAIAVAAHDAAVNSGSIGDRLGAEMEKIKKAGGDAVAVMKGLFSPDTTAIKEAETRLKNMGIDIDQAAHAMGLGKQAMEAFKETITAAVNPLNNQAGSLQRNVQALIPLIPLLEQSARVQRAQYNAALDSASADGKFSAAEREMLTVMREKIQTTEKDLAIAKAAANANIQQLGTFANMRSAMTDAQLSARGLSDAEIEVIRAIDKGTVSWSDYGREVEKAKDKSEGIESVAKETRKGFDALTGLFRDFLAQMASFLPQTRTMALSVNGIGKAAVDAGGNISELTKKTDDATKAMDGAAKGTNTWWEGLKKLGSNIFQGSALNVDNWTSSTKKLDAETKQVGTTVTGVTSTAAASYDVMTGAVNKTTGAVSALVQAQTAAGKAAQTAANEMIQGAAQAADAYKSLGPTVSSYNMKTGTWSQKYPTPGLPDEGPMGTVVKGSGTKMEYTTVPREGFESQWPEQLGPMIRKGTGPAQYGTPSGLPAPRESPSGPYAPTTMEKLGPGDSLRGPTLPPLNLLKKSDIDDVDKLSTDLTKLGEVGSTAFEKLSSASEKLGEPLKQVSIDTTKLAETAPELAQAFGNFSADVTKDSTVFDELGQKAATLGQRTGVVTTDLQAMAQQLTSAGNDAGQDGQKFADLTNQFGTLKTAATGFDDVLGKEVTAFNDLAPPLQKAKEGTDGVDVADSTLVSVTDQLIGKLYAEAQAFNQVAAAAQMAAQAAGSVPSGPSGSAPQPSADSYPAGRKGGIIGESITESAVVASSAFDNAPQFRSGGVTGGGGIPAVLHPHEAVVPLPDGRSIPVSLDAAGLTEAIHRLREVLETRAEGGGLAPTPPWWQAPAKNSGDRIVLDQAPAQNAGSKLNFTSENTENQSSTSTVGRGRQAMHINFHVQATDADSFRRTEDQIIRELQQRLTRVQNRLGT